MARVALPERVQNWNRETWAKVSRIGMLGGTATFAMSGTAAAQTAEAGTICGTGGYNLFLAVMYVVMGASIAMVITSAVAGAGLKSFGWVGRTISQMGNRALIGSFGAMIVLAIVLSVIGMAYTNVSVQIPSECVIPI